MTDAEIIKALECCKNDDCDNCPNNFGNCYANLAGYALDLINRQNAEIKKLQKENNQFADIGKLYSEIKAEAIREFAERLKETDGYNNHIFDDCASVLVPDEYRKGRDEKTKEVREAVDNLVKEMAGEMQLLTHSNEEWEKAVENVKWLRDEARLIPMGFFYVAECNRMLLEYEQGNRSDELFEEMNNAH